MESFRLVLELVYFTSAPLLVVIASIGLWELKIAKDTARLHATRHSLSLAAERCEYYHSSVEAHMNELNAAVERHGGTLLEKAEVTVRGQEIQVKLNLGKKEMREELDKFMKIVPEICLAFNALDAFAVFFTSGVADERVAYSCVGATFCNTVRSHLPSILILNQEGSNYQSIIELFTMWNNRAEAEQLMRSRESIQSELDGLDDSFIRPVGT